MAISPRSFQAQFCLVSPLSLEVIRLAVVSFTPLLPLQVGLQKARLLLGLVLGLCRAQVLELAINRTPSMSWLTI